MKTKQKSEYTWRFTPDPNFKPLNPDERAQARRITDKILGIHSPTLTPQELEVLAEKSRISSAFSREDILRRQGLPVPFPLEEIYYYTDEGQEGAYDHDDPEFLERVSGKAHGAIRDYRRHFFKPGLLLNKEQLKIATELALDIRTERPDFRNVLFAADPDNPTDWDFIQLGEWFLDYQTAIIKENAGNPYDSNNSPITIQDFLKKRCRVKSEAEILSIMGHIQQAKKRGKIKYPQAITEPGEKGGPGEWHEKELEKIWPVWTEKIKALPPIAA